jgi:hypothetical protein
LYVPTPVWTHLFSLLRHSLVINTLSQVFFISTSLKPRNLKSPNSVLTLVVSKTFAGIGVLDLLHNTSAAYFKDAASTTLVKVATGLGFGAAASVSN